MTNRLYSPSQNLVFLSDNYDILPLLEDQSYQLIYIDPPFNTGKEQAKKSISTIRSQDGDRIGFKGARYKSVIESHLSYGDSFDDYLSFLEPRLFEAHRLLKDSGTLYLHLDYREVHYAKVLLDQIFGRDCFLNEIIWAYDYGARARRKWPTKHDNILVYVKDPKKYFFDSHEVDREPYMAPGLVTKEKAEKGKLPTDVWWHTIVSPTGREKTGYPTQKPEGILRRIINASTKAGDPVLDFFAGSGTTGAVAYSLNRTFTLIDSSTDAIDVMKRRFARLEADVKYVDLTHIVNADDEESA